MHLNGKVNYNPQGVVVVVPVVVVPHVNVAAVVAVAPKIEYMSSMCVITTICFCLSQRKEYLRGCKILFYGEFSGITKE